MKKSLVYLYRLSFARLEPAILAVFHSRDFVCITKTP